MSRTPEQQAGLDFEQEWAKRLGARLTPGSGNQWHTQGDVAGKGFIWSLKYTSKESFRLTRGMLHEIIRIVHGPGGRGGSAIPAMAVRLQEEDYVVLLASDFFKLMQEDIKFVPPTKADEKRERARLPKFIRERESE